MTPGQETFLTKLDEFADFFAGGDATNFSIKGFFSGGIPAVLLRVLIALFLYFVLPNLLCRHRPRMGRRIFTFDDGPTPGVTERVLDILDAAGERAIFFVLAEKALAHPELIREITERGHEIGFHGEKHVLLPKLFPVAEWMSLSRGLASLRSMARVRFFRPPHGTWTLTTLFFSLSHGLIPFHWSKLVADWENPATDELVRRLRAIDGPDTIFVLHDGTEGKAHPDAATNMPAALEAFFQLPKMP